jgi:hypothetical protein
MRRFELGAVLGVEPVARRPHHRAREHAAAVQDLLADREPDARLLLVADRRQIGVEQRERVLGPSGDEALVHVDQHLGEGKAAHRAIGAARQLERVVQGTVADQGFAAGSDALAAARLRERGSLVDLRLTR